MARPADAGAVAARMAIEQVLRAERDAQAGIAEAQRAAEALREAARQDALAIAARARERIARWQRGHARALDGRLAALRSRALAANGEPPPAEALAQAARAVAAWLTTAQAPADANGAADAVRAAHLADACDAADAGRPSAAGGHDPEAAA
ncbi:MAG: hypothetical protein HYZ20_04765 [Burkholderiales bacterium]|nr:hypothetical protein [Burkholderiales bacterium]